MSKKTTIDDLIKYHSNFKMRDRRKIITNSEGKQIIEIVKQLAIQLEKETDINVLMELRIKRLENKLKKLEGGVEK